MSNSPNDIYLFVSCLECIDVDAWTGTTPDQQASFEPQEYERIMQLLNFPDQYIRKKV
jgi:AP-4 complex subunit epsilon-1